MKPTLAHSTFHLPQVPREPGRVGAAAQVQGKEGK